MATPELPVRRRIRPAGWAVILLVFGGLGYAGYHFLHESVAYLWHEYVGGESRHRAKPRPAGLVVPDGGLARDIDAGSPDAGHVDVGSDGGAPDATAPSTALVDAGLIEAGAADGGVATDAGRAVRAIPGVALPPWSGEILKGIEKQGLEVNPVSSESEAIRAVAHGESSAAIVSVAAFADSPDALAAGVRATALYVVDANQAAVGPSADPKRLRATKLGAVRGSAGHFALLQALGNQPHPAIALFDSGPALEHAWATGQITGGELPASLRRSAGPMRPELIAPASALWVCVERTEGHGALACTLPDAGSGTFTALPDTFPALFNAAAQTWARANLPAATGEGLRAFDLGRRVIEPAAPEKTPAPPAAPASATPATDGGITPSPPAPPSDAGIARPQPTAPPPPPVPELGFPSWIDRTGATPSGSR